MNDVNSPRGRIGVTIDGDAITNREFNRPYCVVARCNASHRFALRILLAFAPRLMFQSSAQRYVARTSIIGAHLPYAARSLQHHALVRARERQIVAWRFCLNGHACRPGAEDRSNPSSVAFTVASCMAPS